MLKFYIRGGYVKKKRDFLFKFVSLLVCLIFILQTSSVSFAESSSEPLAPTHVNSCDKLLDSVSVEEVERTVSLENNTETIKITNQDIVKKYIEENDFEKPSNLIPAELTFVRSLSNENNQNNYSQSLAPASYYLKNKTATSACGSSVLKKVSGNSGSLTLSFSSKIAASWNTSVGVSASVVSAGVGFNVSAEYSVTQSNTIDTNGRYAEIRAYAEYTGYRFDVWESGWFGDKKVGNGTALRPVGICFVTYR